MSTPLYQELSAPAQLPSGGHAGLWYDRFFNEYEHNFLNVPNGGKSAWIKTVTSRSCGSSDALTEHAGRLAQLTAAIGGAFRVYRATTYFVTGMGNSHPIENGLTWHHTLGTPYLPGSAVKGLVRAVVETAYEGADRDQILKRWFGTTEKGDVAEQAGALIFMDALPIEPVILHNAIMTPHMDDWYLNGQKGGSDPRQIPGDWHAPVPIPYLVTKNISLVFAIAARDPADSALVKEAFQALDHGLAYLGAGGKTAIGYGLMVQDASKEQKLRSKIEGHLDKIRREGITNLLSPEQLEIHKLGERLEAVRAAPSAGDASNSVLLSDIMDLLERARDWATEDRQALVTLVKAGKDKKFLVSKNKDKDFKQALNTLV